VVPSSDLLLPAPLGAGPWRGAVCGACTDARMGNDGRVLRSVRAAQRRRIRIKPAAAPLTRAFFAKYIWPRPVFGKIQNKGLRRFTLRGKQKVDTQWKLFTLVHNIEKIGHYAAA
jgi:Transposase DDE domain